MSTRSTGTNAAIIGAVITGLATIIAAVIAVNAANHGGGGGGGSGGGGSNQEPDYSNRVGVYTGEGLNKTTGSRTTAALDLQSIDGNTGNVEGYLDLNTSSDPSNTAGRGNVSGTIAEDATMHLAGDIYAGQYVFDSEFDCRFTDPEAIECTGTLDPRPGNPSGSHEVTLSLTKS
jgi:hypothetical protein